jgi:hypothetical protein
VGKSWTRRQSHQRCRTGHRNRGGPAAPARIDDRRAVRKLRLRGQAPQFGAFALAAERDAKSAPLRMLATVGSSTGRSCRRGGRAPQFGALRWPPSTPIDAGSNAGHGVARASGDDKQLSGTMPAAYEFLRAGCVG